MGFNIADTGKKRVVIIGGGFGGLKLANRLKGSHFQIVLIDKNNYHQFPPLLYQVASSGLESSSISFPFRKIFQKRKDFFFRLAEVKAVVREKNLILTSIGELKYDYLVIASGTVTNFVGNEVIQSQALPMKTIEEALILRNTLLSNFEKATICTDPQEKQALIQPTARLHRLAGLDGRAPPFHPRRQEQDHGADRMGMELFHLRPVHPIDPVHSEEGTG